MPGEAIVGIIDLNPYLLAIQVVVDILEWTGVIPDPISALIGAFTGRPREQATAQVIARLAKARNPAARFYGITLSRMLTDWDVPISDSSAFGQRVLGEAFHNFVMSMVAQGTPIEHARAIGVHALSRQAQAGAPLEPELMAPLHPGTQISGPQRLLDEYNTGLQSASDRGLAGPQAQRAAEQYVYKHGRIVDLLATQITPLGHPTIPPDGTPPPTQDGTPPPPQLPPSSPPPIQQPAPPPDLTLGALKANIDERMQTQVGDPLRAIAQALAANGGDLGNLTTIITQVLAPLVGGEAVSAAFQQLITVLGSGDSAAIPAAIKALVDCLCPNLDALTKQITTYVTESDWSQPVIDYFVQQGAIPADIAQFLGGRTFAPVHGAAATKAIADWHGTIDNWTRWLDARTPVLWDGIRAWFQRTWQAAESDIKTFAEQKVAGTKLTLEEIVNTVLSALAGAETTIPRDLFKLASYLGGIGAGVTPDNVEEAAFGMLGAAFLVGQGLHLLSAIAGFLGYPMSSVWGNNAEMIVEMLSYKEILGAFHKSFYQHAIAERSRQRHAKEFQPFIPARGEALIGWARGKYTDAELATLLDYSGTDPAWREQLKAVAFRPIQPFMLAAGFVDQDLPTDQLNAALTNSAFSPSDHDLVYQLIELRSLTNVRQKYIAAAEAAAQKGVISLADLDSALDQAKFGHEAKHLVHQGVLLAQQSEIAAAVERDTIAELEGGEITADEARAQIDAAGIQPWRRDVTVTLGATKAGLKEALKEQAAERQAAHQIQLALNRAAVAQYDDGTLDADQLAAALTAALTGYLDDLSTLGATAQELARAGTLGASLIAAQVSAATAARAGRPRLVYGLRLDPAAAQLVTAEVDATKEAVLRLDLTPAAALANLEALKLPTAEAVRLVARWKYQIEAKGSIKLG